PRICRRGARPSRVAHSRVPVPHASPAPTAYGCRGPEISALIDLHTHTTASDGWCTPAELVSRASAAGLTVLSVTDHDTIAGCAAAAVACAAASVEFVPGIEITAVRDGTDVHTLGYFVDIASPPFLSFL